VLANLIAIPPRSGERSYRRQTVETRRAVPRGSDSKPPRLRSGERSYVTSLRCYKNNYLDPPLHDSARMRS
jgi:hypothetical protein